MEEIRLPFRMNADHPCFDGHFPGRPIVPGVVLLDAVQAAARRAWSLGPLVQLPAIKFIAALLPDETAELRLQRKEPGAVSFQVSCGERLLAQGTLRFEG